MRVAVFLRSFAIQGSWNYRSLIGHGFAFALLPALRAIYRGDPEGLGAAVERHAQLFNSHPYLAPMALGAVATLEAEGEDHSVLERFKTAVRGSLGTIGDRLVWAGWRPVCLLFALAVFFAGAPWWVAVGGFLVVYNAGHLFLRIWSYRLGLQDARRVGESMRRSGIGSVQRVLPVIGAFLVGLIVPLAVTGRSVWHAMPAGSTASTAWTIAAVVAALAGARFGQAVRMPVVVALLIFCILGLFLGIVS